jgi:hypothetical protein
VNALSTNPFAATLMACACGTLRVEGSGKFRPEYCVRNMNPDSSCYLYDEMLRVQYAAYPNMENKNCIHTMMIENQHKINIYSVTCQHFVGLRNGVSRQRPVNKLPRSRDDVTRVYVVARRQAAIFSDCKRSGRRDVTALLSETTQRPLL